MKQSAARLSSPLAQPLAAAATATVGTVCRRSRSRLPRPRDPPLTAVMGQQARGEHHQGGGAHPLVADAAVALGGQHHTPAGVSRQAGRAVVGWQTTRSQQAALCTRLGRTTQEQMHPRCPALPCPALPRPAASRRTSAARRPAGPAAPRARSGAGCGRPRRRGAVLPCPTERPPGREARSTAAPAGGWHESEGGRQGVGSRGDGSLRAACH